MLLRLGRWFEVECHMGGLFVDVLGVRVWFSRGGDGRFEWVVERGDKVFFRHNI